MKDRRIFWGWLFIIVGLLWWAANMKWIKLPWERIEDLWPVILIGGGILTLPTSRPVKLAIGLLCLAGIAFMLYTASQYQPAEVVPWQWE